MNAIELTSELLPDEGCRLPDSHQTELVRIVLDEPGRTKESGNSVSNMEKRKHSGIKQYG